MENKQDVILNLLNTMSDLMRQLTLDINYIDTDELEQPIRSTQKALDKFMCVFIDNSKISKNKLIQDLVDSVNYFHYPQKSKERITPYDAESILEYREKIRDIWRRQDRGV